MITGTSHFVTKSDAIEYYMGYEYGSAAARRVIAKEVVERKLAAGEIHLGPPELKPGERLLTVDDGQRYAVESE